MKTPWRHILTSLPVWAVVVAHTAHNWGFWLLLTEMPQFFSSVLKINIKEVSQFKASTRKTIETIGDFLLNWKHVFQHVHTPQFPFLYDEHGICI